MPSYDDDGIGRVEVRRLGVSRARRTRSSTWRRDLGSGTDFQCSVLREVQVIGPIPVCRPAQIRARLVVAFFVGVDRSIDRRTRILKRGATLQGPFHLHTRQSVVSCFFISQVRRHVERDLVHGTGA